jgi:phosphoserine phosphatase
VQIQSPDEILARILDAARARPGGVAATDGDGTLWSGDVGEDVFLAFIERGRVAPPAAEAIAREAREHGLDATGPAIAVARRIYDAYVAHRFPEERVCELMTWCFAGWTREELTAFARAVAARARVVERLHEELGEVLAGVRDAGIEIVLVSASPRAIVEAAARFVDGVTFAHVVAATPRWNGSAMMPDVERPIPYGPGKVRGLRAAIGAREIYAAFGDNAFDVSMLGEASVPVAVRPKDALRARAGEVPALVELARA